MKQSRDAMFTGLVREKGRVVELAATRGLATLAIEAPGLAPGTLVGDSVAVDGACLTVTAREGSVLRFDLSPETLTRTTLGRRRKGDEVNLEDAVTPSTPLGGHYVLGHVDGVGKIAAVRKGPRAWVVRFRVPAGLSRQLVPKGSVAVDGISLTVNEVRGDTFTVTLIPQTLASVTLGSKRAGLEVNVETDILVKSVERLLQAGASVPRRKG